MEASSPPISTVVDFGHFLGIAIPSYFFTLFPVHGVVLMPMTIEIPAERWYRVLGHGVAILSCVQGLVQSTGVF